MATENFYPGTNYPLDTEYGDTFTGYRVPAGKIGMTTDARTANQLNETANKLNTGAQKIEVGAIQPNVFESIPDQHLKEINRLTKLTGSNASLHGPMVEPSGYNQQGGWSEAQREQAEKQIWSAVERGSKLSDQGNIPVTFHPAYQLPTGAQKMKTKEGEEYTQVVAVDTTTGKPQVIRKEPKVFPEKAGQEFKPEQEITELNKRAWTQTLNNLNFYAQRGEEAIRATGIHKDEKEVPPILKNYGEENRDEILNKLVEKGDMSKLGKQRIEDKFRALDHGSIFLRDSYNQLRQLFNQVYKHADPEDKKKLDRYRKEIEPLVKTEGENFEEDPKKMKKFAEVVQKGVRTLGKVKRPQLFKPLNEFVTEQDSQTFGNTAFKAYEKFGEKAPTISIENPPAGTALDTGEDIKKVVEESRKRFSDKAIKEKGMSKKKADKIAEKLIGATWDVGHINMLKKYGYDKSDIAEESKKVAPFVKHMHLSDNFGMEHTEIPMGMGNVPFKEIMKSMGKKGKDARKIIEAADWYQHFRTIPFPESLEAMGSGLYPMKSPYWNQMVNTQASYSSGYGEILPQQHFTTYGGGFSGMPSELGGQMPGQQAGGKQSRMGGAPMQ